MAETRTEGIGVTRSVGHKYAMAAPGSGVDIITPFTPTASCAAIRVTVCLTTSSVFNVKTTDGTTAYSNALNSGTALVAGAVYTFTFGARATSADAGSTALTYSFSVTTDGVIRFLFVEEVLGQVV